jgi:N-acetylmuramoyl-L-alanine amidase
MKRIALSSGHGLHVAGVDNLINEVEENRRVVRDVARTARRESLFSVFEIHDDVSTSRDDNLNFIVGRHNRLERDLDVSVHFNAFKPTPKQRGVEVLYRNPENRRLAAAVSAAIAVDGGFRNRGAKTRKNLRFLNQAARPAILIEVCFTDSEEDVRLYKENYEAIVNAIAFTLAEWEG